jgi:hypothetical protein
VYGKSFYSGISQKRPQNQIKDQMADKQIERLGQLVAFGNPLLFQNIIRNIHGLPELFRKKVG